MILVSIEPKIYCNNVAFATAEQFQKLANSKPVINSLTSVQHGHLDKKKFNYFYLPNAVPASFQPNQDYRGWIFNRKGMNLIPNGKVFLDIDIHDPDRAMKIYSQIDGLEEEFGVLHAEYSIRGGLHIIVRRLKNLTLEQTISWWQ